MGVLGSYRGVLGGNMGSTQGDMGVLGGVFGLFLGYFWGIFGAMSNGVIYSLFKVSIYIFRICLTTTVAQFSLRSSCTACIAKLSPR